MSLEAAFLRSSSLCKEKEDGYEEQEDSQENVHDLFVAFGFLKWWGKMGKQDWFLRERHSMRNKMGLRNCKTK